MDPHLFDLVWQVYQRSGSTRLHQRRVRLPLAGHQRDAAQALARRRQEQPAHAGQGDGLLHRGRAARQAARHRPADAARRRRLLPDLRLALRPHGHRQRAPLAAHDPPAARRRSSRTAIPSTFPPTASRCPATPRRSPPTRRARPPAPRSAPTIRTTPPSPPTMQRRAPTTSPTDDLGADVADGKPSADAVARLRRRPRPSRVAVAAYATAPTPTPRLAPRPTAPGGLASAAGPAPAATTAPTVLASAAHAHRLAGARFRLRPAAGLVGPRRARRARQGHGRTRQARRSASLPISPTAVVATIDVSRPLRAEAITTAVLRTNTDARAAPLPTVLAYADADPACPEADAAAGARAASPACRCRS